MNLRFEEAIQLLSRTPASLEAFLSGLPERDGSTAMKAKERGMRKK